MIDFKPNLIQQYVGDLNSNNQRHGHGSQHWNYNAIQKYHGQFLYNNLHNEGVYTFIKPDQKFMYEGSFYANNFEGYSRVTIGNCTYFEGLFKSNKRFGPGILTYQNGSQDVGIWDGLNLIRLSTVVLPEWIPTLGKTSLGKCKLLRYRKIVKICGNVDHNQVARIADTLGTDKNEFGDMLFNNDIGNSKSCFFNRNAYDLTYFGEENCEIDVAMNQEDILELQVRAMSGYEEEEDILGNFLQKQLIINDVIESLFRNVSRFQQCSPDEMWLINLKRDFIEMLSNTTTIKQTTVPSKKLKVTELLTWNNEELCIDILKHTFLHRNRENILSFNIKNLLIGNRNSFGETGAHECICMAFLTSCSEGRSLAIYEFCNQYNLNPDLSDSKGNSGIIYAAARDRIGVIRTLTQLGAKLDLVNDEGLTALNMAILRYIAQYRNVINWEAAFLPNDNNCDDDTNIWHERKSLLNLISHTILANIKHEQSLFYQDNNKLISYDFKVLYNQDDVSILTEQLGLIKTNNPNFQEPYTIDELQNEKYIFDTSFVTVNTDKVKLKKVKSALPKVNENKFSENENQDKLDVIYNTILVLLHYGADINVSEVPMPSISLAIFTENANMVRHLIELGGNPNLRNIDGLTTLHILVSLPASPNLALLCSTLLELGADPNARTESNHWPQLKNEIIGNSSNDIEDIGKTPLHIIGIRKDYILDPLGYLNDVAKVLVLNKASVVETYLAHTTLTLAILRGNNGLVKTLLESGDDPNCKLLEGLGSPITIYILKRYSKSLPPVDTAKLVYNTLFDYFGNPLNPIESFGNAIEFMRDNEYELPKTDSVKPKSGKAGKKGKKSKKDKKSVKSKTHKLTAEEEMKLYLLELARKAGFRHYQCKALLAIMSAILNQTYDTIQFFKDVAKLLTPDDANRIFQILIDAEILSTSDEFQFILMTSIMNYVIDNGSKTKPKQKKSEIKSKYFLSKLQPKIDKKKINLKKLKVYELDSVEDKYIFCFYCGLRTDKILLPCPKCGLVYFCSEECNKLSIKSKPQHPCKVVFYNKERARYDECIKNGVPYISQQAAHLDAFKNILNAIKNLKNEIKTASNNPELIEKLMMEIIAKDPDFENPFVPNGKYNVDKKHLKRGISFSQNLRKSGEDEKGKKRDKRSGSRSRRGKSGKGSRGKSGKGSRGKSGKGSRGKGSKGSRGKSSKGSRGKKRGKSSRSRSRKGGSLGRKGRKGSRSKSKHKSRSGSRYGKTDKYGRETFSLAHGKHGYDTAALDKIAGLQSREESDGLGGKENEDQLLHLGNLPEKYRLLLQKLAELFPDFDMSALFLPFVCFVDGQWYYRFMDDHPIYCPTYSSV